jgi:hypothetical protein
MRVMVHKERPMTTFSRRLLWIPLAALVIIAAHARSSEAQERTTPRPEVVQLSEAVIAAVNGADAAVDKLVKEFFAPEYQKARSAEERRKWFEPIRAKYGKISLTGLRRSAEDTFTIVAAGDKNATLSFVVTHDATYKVTGLALEESGTY